jgi:hypothetical protein
MSYCYDFIKKFRKEGNFCGLDRAEMSRLEAYIEIVDMLMKQHRELDEKKVIESFPLGAARVIIPLKDDRRTEGLCFVTERLLAQKRVTARDLQSKLEISKTKVESTSKQEKKPDKTELEKPSRDPELAKKASFCYQPGEAPKPSDCGVILGEEIRKSEFAAAAANQPPAPEKPIPATVTGLTPEMKTCRYKPEVPCSLPIGEKCDPACQIFLKSGVASEWSTEVCRTGKCPDNQCHLVKGQIGDRCNLSGSFIKDQKFCPYLERQRRAAAGGFVPASQCSVTGGKILQEHPPLVVKKNTMQINWEPSPQQASFIHRVMRTDGHDTPAEALSAIVDRAMGAE